MCTLTYIREALLFHIYSGDVFFTAATILALAVVADLCLRESRNNLVRPSIRILFLLSLPLGALGTVPLPLWIALPLIGAWAAHAIYGFGRGSRRAAMISGGFLLVVVCISLVPEIAWRVRQPPDTAPPSTLYVFGDSLSSGGFGENRTWVDRLNGTGGVTLVNLSRPSDTTGSALESSIDDLPRSCNGCGVVIELGGNEMLGEGSAGEYEQNLRTLIAESRRRGAGTVWLVEFPPLPFRWWWSAAQRRTARETDSILVPRRVLSSILIREAHTFDGLHLTDRGHQSLARHMSRWLGVNEPDPPSLLSSRTKSSPSHQDPEVEP